MSPIQMEEDGNTDSICYWTQVQLFIAQESNTKRQVLGKRKDTFIEGASNPGEKVDSCHKEPTPSCPPGGSFQREISRVYRQWLGFKCRIPKLALMVILKLVTWWSDQCHLDCLNYSSSIFSSRINFFLFLWGQPSEFWQLNRLVPNRKRSVSRLYIVTLLI